MFFNQTSPSLGLPSSVILLKRLSDFVSMKQQFWNFLQMDSNFHDILSSLGLAWLLAAQMQCNLALLMAKHFILFAL
jgi:hypothetical protein